MSDTPETDKLITDWIQGDSREIPDFVLLARRLERERDEAREDLEFRRGLYKVQEQYLETARRERDEAREQIKELIYIGERAIALADIDFENDKFGVVSELRDDLKKIKEGAK
jgi:hypothetical protein